MQAAHQRLFDQRLQHVSHPRRVVERCQVDHRLGRGQGEAAFEHRQLRQRCAFGGHEQIPRPIQRRAQRRLAIVPAAAAGQQAKAFAHAQHLVGRRHDARARRGEFDGQRQLVEQGHQLRQRGSVCGAQLRLKARGLHALQEHGLRFFGRHRRQHLHLLAGQAQHLAAGDDEARQRQGVQPHSQSGLGAACHLLEVVQHQQAFAARSQCRGELLHGICLAQRQVQRLGDGQRNAVAAARCGQVAEPRAAGVAAQPAAGVALCQTGLADAAHAQQADQPRAVFEASRQRAQCVVAADKGVGLGTQVVRQLVHRQPQAAALEHAVGLGRVGRRGAGRFGRRHLEQCHRLVQPLQAPMAVRVHLQLAHRSAAEYLHRRLAEQRLPALRHRHHARRGGQRQAVDLKRRGPACDVSGAVLAQHHRAPMHTDAGAEWHLHGSQRSVVVEREVKRVVAAIEHQQKAVAAAHLAAVPSAQGRAGATVVLCPQAARHLVTHTRMELGAVDHVGQDQRRHLLGGIWKSG